MWLWQSVCKLLHDVTVIQLMQLHYINDLRLMIDKCSPALGMHERSFSVLAGWNAPLSWQPMWKAPWFSHVNYMLPWLSNVNEILPIDISVGEVPFCMYGWNVSHTWLYEWNVPSLHYVNEMLPWVDWGSVILPYLWHGYFGEEIFRLFNVWGWFVPPSIVYLGKML